MVIEAGRGGQRGAGDGTGVGGGVGRRGDSSIRTSHSRALESLKINKQRGDDEVSGAASGGGSGFSRGGGGRAEMARGGVGAADGGGGSGQGSCETLVKCLCRENWDAAGQPGPDPALLPRCRRGQRRIRNGDLNTN